MWGLCCRRLFNLFLWNFSQQQQTCSENCHYCGSISEESHPATTGKCWFSAQTFYKRVFYLQTVKSRDRNDLNFFGFALSEANILTARCGLSSALAVVPVKPRASSASSYLLVSVLVVARLPGTPVTNQFIHPSSANYSVHLISSNKSLSGAQTLPRPNSYLVHVELYSLIDSNHQNTLDLFIYSFRQGGLILAESHPPSKFQEICWVIFV